MGLLEMFPDAKSRLLAIACFIAVILGIVGSIVNGLLSFGFWLNLIQIGLGLAGLFGAWRRHMFALWIAMVGFGILAILSIINGIINLTYSNPNVVAAIMAFISAACWFGCTFLAWLVRDKKILP